MVRISGDSAGHSDSQSQTDDDIIMISLNIALYSVRYSTLPKY